MSNVRAFWTHVVAACVAVMVAACGGGETSAPAGADPTPLPPPAPVLARLEVAPSTVLLAGAGQARQLSVKGFDANGAQIALPELTFSSSRPAEVAVRADGTVTAVAPVGSALVTVSSGSVSAAPLLVAVAEPVAGAVLVSDEQVVTAPVAVDPAAVPGVGFQYRARLSGLAPPAVGAIVLGTGGQPVGGRVVSASPVGNDVDVLFESVALPALFKELSVEFSFPPEVTAGLLRPVGAPARAASSNRAQAAAFNGATCKSGVGGDILTGELKVKLDPSIRFDARSVVSNGEVKGFELSAKGPVNVTGRAVLNLGAVATADVTCYAQLLALPIPVTGPLSAFLAPVIPLGGKLKLAAQIGANAFSYGAELKQQIDVDMGIRYTEADGLSSTKTLTYQDPEFKPNVDYPSQASLRVRASVFVGGYSGLSIGNALVAFDLMELSIGPEFEAKYGWPYDVSQDTLYQAEDGLKVKATIAPGKNIKDFISFVFGTNKPIDVSASLEKKLARSAQATKLVADRDQYQAGEVLTFDVKLDPATVSYPVFGYSVSEVRVYRLDHGASTALPVASATAVDGQSDFRLTWTPAAAGRVADPLTGKSNFFAFVVDRLMPVTMVLAYELGEIKPTRDVSCTSAKRFCAVAHDVNIAVSDVDIHVNEAGVIYVADWRFGALAVYPPGGQVAGGGSSRNPPRGGMPSRSGKFVVRDDAGRWGVEDASNPRLLKFTPLPAKTAGGESINWQAVADTNWIIGNVPRPNGGSVAVRIDGNVVDAVNGVVAPVEELAILGSAPTATDINDAGQIVGVTASGLSGKVFVWDRGSVTYIDPPAGTGCFHVTINLGGTLLAVCTGASQTYAYLRSANEAAWTKVTASVSGPEPAAWYPLRANGKGQVVAATVRNGVFDDIVLWEAGTTYSLLANTGFDVGAPTQLFLRAGINDKNQIGIWAATDPTGPKRVYLVSPNAAYQPVN